MNIRHLFFPFIFVLTLQGSLLSPLSRADDDPRYLCFRRHIQEAIALNQERLPKYSELSHGSSESISRSLIRYERLTLFFAYLFDWRAGKYQAKGIPVLCDEFVSMSKVPPFQGVIEHPSTPMDPPQPLDTYYIRREIKAAYKKDNFEGVNHFLTPYLEKLEKSGPYHCMMKHVLESILATARLAPGFREAASVKGTPSTETLSWNFIRLQLFSLEKADQLDSRAFPLHLQGIPIICGDVPKII